MSQFKFPGNMPPYTTYLEIFHRSLASRKVSEMLWTQHPDKWLGFTLPTGFAMSNLFSGSLGCTTVLGSNILKRGCYLRYPQHISDKIPNVVEFRNVEFWIFLNIYSWLTAMAWSTMVNESTTVGLLIIPIETSRDLFGNLQASRNLHDISSGLESY